MDLSLFGIVKNINKLSNNHENFDGNNLSTTEVIILIISLVIAVVLLIWTIYVLATFKLPQEILILSIVLLFLTGPVIPLVLAYVFRNKQL